MRIWIRWSVINNGEFIEDVTYRYIPVIRDVNGQGKDCPGTDYDSITVQVAPELRGILEPDTSYVGGNIVRCYGEEVSILHPNVRGGYYRDEYDFDWDTNGGTTPAWYRTIPHRQALELESTGSKWMMSLVATLAIPLP